MDNYVEFRISEVLCGVVTCVCLRVSLYRMAVTAPCNIILTFSLPYVWAYFQASPASTFSSTLRSSRVFDRLEHLLASQSRCTPLAATARPSGRFDFDYLQDDYPHLAVIFDVGRRTNQNSSVREYSDVVLSSAPVPINTPPTDPYQWFHPYPLLE